MGKLLICRSIFFFQAEDGIRDLTVTGVQTCALPISRLGGWEFEIPDYKYAAIFRPLEELLKKLPQPVKKTAMESAPGKVPAAGKTRQPASPQPASRRRPAGMHHRTIPTRLILRHSHR